MPTFKGQVSEEEIIELIAFIQSLSRGQTPTRVEDFPPPRETPDINARRRTAEQCTDGATGTEGATGSSSARAGGRLPRVRRADKLPVAPITVKADVSQFPSPLTRGEGR